MKSFGELSIKHAATMGILLAAAMTSVSIGIQVQGRHERNKVISMCLEKGAQDTHVESLAPVGKADADLVREAFVLNVKACLIENN